jgi:hypothetical protein
MVSTINKPKEAKKGYTLSLSKEEIEKELSLIFDPQICPECRQDHNFKNSFEDVRTSIDDFLKYSRNRISGISMSIVGGKMGI